MSTEPVIVVGGGICGLACAYELKRAGLPVILLEQAPRAGGVIDSLRQDGFTFELGPQSFLSTPALTDLVRSLGIEEHLLQAPASAPRFILAGGKLQPAPMSPPALIKSPLFGARTKFRLMREPMSRTSPPAADESVGAFVRRKFGQDLLDNLVAPFVSGVYAGDADQLSLRAAFPQVYQWERDFGSVIRGAMKSRDPNKPRGGLCTFRGGMQTLPQALLQALAENVKLNWRVEAVRAAGDGQPRFDVQLQRDGHGEVISARGVVIATPAYVTAGLLSGVAAAAIGPLSQIDYAPVAVVNAGYRREDVRHSLEGFGFLVSRRQHAQILGTVWNSSLFPGRAPEGHVNVATFVGGALNREAVQRDDASLLDAAEREHAAVLGLNARAVATRIARYARAIAQYNLGHMERITAIESAVARVPGLFLAGNYFSGPAVGACVENGQATARRVVEFLKSR